MRNYSANLVKQSKKLKRDAKWRDTRSWSTSERSRKGNTLPQAGEKAKGAEQSSVLRQLSVCFIEFISVSKSKSW